MNNLQKFKIDERIKISYLRNLGDIELVLKELDIPPEYILKRISKIKKTESTQDRNAIAESIMEYLDVGYKARRIRLLEMLNSLDGAEQARISLCCNYPVIFNESETTYECLKCKKVCETKIANYVDIYSVKKDLIEQLREEDKHLVEFARKMGYTNTVVPDILIQKKQNIVVLGNSKRPGNIDEGIAVDIEHLSAMERDKITDNLNKKIIELENKQDEAADGDKGATREETK